MRLKRHISSVSNIVLFLSFFLLLPALISPNNIPIIHHTRALAASNGTPTTGEADFLDETIRNEYESHLNRCGKIPLAGIAEYNTAYKILKWIENNIGTKWDERMPPICLATRKEFNDALFERLKWKYGSLKKFENTFKAIGLFKENFNFKKFAESYLFENYHGCYDEIKKRVMLVRKDDGSLPPTHTFLEEMFHSVQDVQYDFSNFLFSNGKPLSTDELNTRVALMEGEAAIVKDLFYKQHLEEERCKFHALSSDEEIYSDVTKELYNLNENYPPYIEIRDFLSYYLSIPFLRQTMGREHSLELMKNIVQSPPTSSEQILHPEKYFDKEEGKKFYEFEPRSINSFFSKNSWKQFDSKVLSLGQIGLAALIKTYIPNADTLKTASGWDGDRTLIYARKEKFKLPNSTFVHLGKWDSPEHATNYFNLLNDMIKMKYKKNFKPIPNDSENTTLYKLSYRYKRDGGRKLVIVAVNGDKTILVERLPWRWKKSFLKINESDLFNFFQENN